MRRSHVLGSRSEGLSSITSFAFFDTDMETTIVEYVAPRNVYREIGSISGFSLGPLSP